MAPWGQQKPATELAGSLSLSLAVDVGLLIDTHLFAEKASRGLGNF